MRDGYYMLMPDKSIKYTEDIRDFGNNRRRRENWQVGIDNFPQIDCSVSTVFLGLDHSFSRKGPPVLFETLISGGAMDGETRRCCTYIEAEAQHAEIVATIKGILERQFENLGPKPEEVKSTLKTKRKLSLNE